MGAKEKHELGRAASRLFHEAYKPADHKKDFPVAKTLVSFESGHYKEFTGTWQGDSVWAHFKTEDGRVIHVNKDKVEYIQTKE